MLLFSLAYIRLLNNQINQIKYLAIQENRINRYRYSILISNDNLIPIQKYRAILSPMPVSRTAHL